ncbi:MAG TPA: class I SAM-dependent methyltransferase [Aeromicrobium sp.]|nr:class I SAM-dependent methyltransferase [Aeromicrobium sp.]HKY58762.1 class I SAM-dependent methyltransferase [Aeromicrobium sp.]
MSNFDAAFMGSAVVMLDDTGAEEPLAVDRWASRASIDDRALIIDHCAGPTIDLGCGPGRLVQALRERGLDSLGVDNSTEAVRLARSRGIPVLHRDVFRPMPYEGRWAHALLADGNVGIGGRPFSLLRRVWAMLAAGGVLHVELDEPGTGVVHTWRQLRVDGEVGRRFAWALVGVDAIAQLAQRAGFAHTDSLVHGGRHVAMLTKVT